MKRLRLVAVDGPGVPEPAERLGLLDTFDDGQAVRPTDLAKVIESLETAGADVRNRGAYAVSALQSELDGRSNAA